LSFGSIAPQISELRGVKNRPFPLTRHIAYTTACCYRTSREIELALCFLVIHALCTADMPTPVHGQKSSTCWSSTLCRRRSSI